MAEFSKEEKQQAWTWIGYLIAGTYIVWLIWSYFLSPSQPVSQRADYSEDSYPCESAGHPLYDGC